MDSPPSHTNDFSRIGMVARWQPVHRGHTPILHALGDHAAHVLIGIGSANAYDYRSPFTLEETMDMLRLVLAARQNFTLLPVPDLHNGPRWREMVIDNFGNLDCFVTANPYVTSLLANDYRIVHPAVLLKEEEKIAIDGHMVRREMARRQNWEALVPEEVTSYIKTRHIDERFRHEFGLQTLALETIIT